MPKLKKYSKIYPHEQPNDQSSQQITQQNNQITTNIHNHQSNHQTKKQQFSDSQSSNSFKSSSDTQQSITSHQKKTKLNPIKNKQNQSKNTQRKKKTQKQKYADQTLKRLQQQCANNQNDNQNSQIQIPSQFISDKKKIKKQKKVKSNKFFQISIENQQHFQGIKQLGKQQLKQFEEIEKQNQAKMIARQQKNQQKKDLMKLKMESKIQQKNNPITTPNAIVLKSLMSQVIDIKQEQEINIDIQVDQIVKGKNARQANGTLFLKKMAKTQSQSQTHNQESTKPNTDIDKKQNKYENRKQFYRDFDKELKQSKAIHFTTQTENLFKISSLDDLDFENNSKLFREQSKSRNSLSNHHDKNHTNRSRLSETSNSNRSLSNNSKNKGENQDRSQNLIRQQTKRTSAKQIPTVVQNLFEEDSRKNNLASQLNIKEIKDLPEKQSRLSNENLKQISIQQPKQGSSQKKQKSKSNKIKKEKQNINKNKKSKKDKFYSNLFEDQAEDSDEQQGDGDNGESSNSDDDDSLQSLIDRNQVIHVQKNQKIARKKLRQEMQRKDDEQYERIKQKILNPRKIKMQQNSESRQKRKRRIKDKQDKFASQDSCDAQFRDHNKEKTTTQDHQSKEQLKQYLNHLENQFTLKDKFQEEKKLQRKTNHILPPLFSDALRKSFKSQDKTKNFRGGFINDNKGIAGTKAQFQPKKSRSKSKEIKY